mgnify:FL=1
MVETVSDVVDGRRSWVEGMLAVAKAGAVWCRGGTGAGQLGHFDACIWACARKYAQWERRQNGGSQAEDVPDDWEDVDGEEAGGPASYLDPEESEAQAAARLDDACRDIVDKYHSDDYMRRLVGLPARPVKQKRARENEPREGDGLEADGRVPGDDAHAVVTAALETLPPLAQAEAALARKHASSTRGPPRSLLDAAAHLSSWSLCLSRLLRGVTRGELDRHSDEVALFDAAVARMTRRGGLLVNTNRRPDVLAMIAQPDMTLYQETIDRLFCAASMGPQRVAVERRLRMGIEPDTIKLAMDVLDTDLVKEINYCQRHYVGGRWRPMGEKSEEIDLDRSYDPKFERIQQFDNSAYYENKAAASLSDLARAVQEAKQYASVDRSAKPARPILRACYEDIWYLYAWTVMFQKQAAVSERTLPVARGFVKMVEQCIYRSDQLGTSVFEDALNDEPVAGMPRLPLIVYIEARAVVVRCTQCGLTTLHCGTVSAIEAWERCFVQCYGSVTPDGARVILKQR